jgi:cytochrome c-type biogenesis protein CcmH
MRAVVLALALLAGPALAVEPSEMLADPGLEARARELSRQLRCPVCQSESIDESDAPVAADLRKLVRERLVAGDSDAEILAYVAARYGEFVLFRPPAQGVNLILWIAGPAMLALGVGVALVALRRGPTAPAEALTPAEEARLRDLTGTPPLPEAERSPPGRG